MTIRGHDFKPVDPKSILADAVSASSEADLYKMSKS